MRSSFIKHPALAACSSIWLAGCVSAPKSVPPPPPPPAAETAQPAVDWRDLPLSPGRWAYVPSASRPIAQFARPGASPDFTIACDRATRNVVLFRAAAAAGPLTVTTSYSAVALPAQSGSDGISATMPSTGEFLDRIAFSRGHVTVAAPGVSLLVLPAWAEPARVIQDCRG